MNRADLAFLWVISGLAALCVVAGKVGMMLYGVSADPPDDPIALAHWERRRRWLACSEMSALPAFATCGVAATVYFNLPPVASVLISMVLGALGFSFFLHCVEQWAKRRMGVDQ